MTLFFSLTTPVGIAIGIGISNVYNKSSPNALIIEGILNAASAGIQWIFWQLILCIQKCKVMEHFNLGLMFLFF
jgi:hypothetical protein